MESISQSMESTWNPSASTLHSMDSIWNNPGRVKYCLQHVLLGWLIVSWIHQPQLTTFHLLAVLHIPCVDLDLEIEWLTWHLACYTCSFIWLVTDNLTHHGMFNFQFPYKSSLWWCFSWHGHEHSPLGWVPVVFNCFETLWCVSWG